VTLRTKLVAALALLAAGATVAIGFFSYAATANSLRSEIDSALKSSARGAIQLAQGDPELDHVVGGPRGVYGGSELERQQVIDATGRPLDWTGSSNSQGSIPVAASDAAIAQRSDIGRGTIKNITIAGDRWRVLTVSIGNGRGAIQIARSLTESDNVLGSLRNRIVLAAVVVVFVGGAVGWLIAYQVTRRLRTLTDTAEHVAKTGELNVDVPVEGSDEAGRLAIAFNEMLSALAKSKEDQQRLVQDAGHELRTPLTSLRTNTSVLRRHELTSDARAQILDDLDSEARELTDLVNELVELATDRSRDEPTERVVLADVAERVAERARRRSGRPINVDADTTIVLGRKQGLERAVSNLVDNALKFDDNGAPIEIFERDGRITVLDRGPGVDPADAPHLFDRFYRSVAARSRPGSGLGLSIVRDIAERHGGSVFVEARPGGGAAIGFAVPPAPPASAENDADH
jgi:two-component system sensor histidine kinase MprB